MSELVWAEREKRLKRIRKVSAFMKWTVTVLLALMLVLGVVITVGIALPVDSMIIPDEIIEIANIERKLSDIPQIQRLAISVIGAIAFVLLALAGWNMRQVFKNFQQMEFFSPKTLANVISFGIWLIVFAVFDLISDPVGSIILTFDYPPGQRKLDITLDGSELFFMVLGMLMLLFGWILREAALIADENRQFV